MPHQWIISALDETWTVLAAQIRDCSERDFDALTACPGWSVRDIVSHIIGVERESRGEPLPELTQPLPPYVRNARGAINEAWVVSNRHASADEIRDEFHEVTHTTLAMMRALRAEEWGAVIDAPGGTQTRAYAFESRIVDSWIHLQDIRDALLEPADDHGVGESVVINRFEALLPYVWAKRVAAPENALLQMNLTGLLGRTVQVRVREGRGVAAAPTSDRPDLEISSDVALFWRRCAGRINAEAFLNASATDVRGDREIAQRFVREMAIVQ